MSEREIPDGVQEWLEFGMDPVLASLETKEFSDLEGASIITGVVGNSLGEEVAEYAEDHSDDDYFAAVDFDEREGLGSMSISFPTRDEAEEFRELVGECGGHLRLSSGKEDGWFLYEAE